MMDWWRGKRRSWMTERGEDGASDVATFKGQDVGFDRIKGHYIRLIRQKTGGETIALVAIQ